MNRNRVFDIVGAVIATLVATVILNQFSLFINFLNQVVFFKVYILCIFSFLVAFFSMLATSYFNSIQKKSEVQKKDLLIKDLKNSMDNLKLEFEELKETATIDVQTGSLNKNQISNVLLSKKGEADTSNLQFCLILVDIDYFKRINDSYDHEVGNLILKQVAELIKPRSREDKFIRYGGDEFLIITKIGDSVNSGYGYAERIRREVQQNNFIINYNSTMREKITISCGVTVYYPNCQDDSDKALERVAKALKVAKSKRENGEEKNFVHIVE